MSNYLYLTFFIIYYIILYYMYFVGVAICNNPFKVEPYSIHGSFLKLEYLKTEFNEDSGTYAIVKVTSHSYRIMVNLSINDYFEVMHP